MILAAIGFLLFACYALLIAFYKRGWRGLQNYMPPVAKKSSTTISVIVPARNEEHQLPNLLRALQQQSYPANLFEVIVVDDFSTDRTAIVARDTGLSNVRIIQPGGESEASSKKKAVAAGVQAATLELIVTTDADCIPGPGWLEALAAFYDEKNAAFIAAPVRFIHNDSMLQVFQSLDFLILQGITAASVSRDFHSMCNGANLAYERKAFEAVNGFEGIDHVASGDDLLLMYKIRQQYPGRVHYLKSEAAIVSTSPMPTLSAFIAQRKRWASKTFVYQDKRIFWALALVYIFNLFFFVLLAAGFFNYWYWIGLVAMVMAKTAVEAPFVNDVASFYRSRELMKYFLFFQPFHIAYTVLVGFISQLGRYEWKGRTTK